MQFHARASINNITKFKRIIKKYITVSPKYSINVANVSQRK